ncbi:hypothetical protein Y032_0623g761 [Ancylostoma ceylanicum]|uniref:Endonuclease/exonuclease/phosphatase domain-containing protein n=1 Tax=Ancylostoma ceylanicum TaxID=53326 RepID=A0A016WK72_9BILA|nr:hypothetical protein Y032_0623g761 [Ancylostoma ceylanicum]
MFNATPSTVSVAGPKPGKRRRVDPRRKIVKQMCTHKEIAHKFSRTNATASEVLADASALADNRDQGADEELNTGHRREKEKGTEKRQKNLTTKRLLKIASWNLCTGHHVAQKENVIRELLRYGISIAVLQELRITGTGCTRVTSPDSDDWMTLYYSEGEHHIEGMDLRWIEELTNALSHFGQSRAE